MAKKENRDAAKLAARVRGAVERMAEAIDNLLSPAPPAPAYVPVRRPTAEELRRHPRRRQG